LKAFELFGLNFGKKKQESELTDEETILKIFNKIKKTFSSKQFSSNCNRYSEFYYYIIDDIELTLIKNDNTNKITIYIDDIEYEVNNELKKEIFDFFEEKRIEKRRKFEEEDIEKKNRVKKFVKNFESFDFEEN